MKKKSLFLCASTILLLLFFPSCNTVKLYDTFGIVGITLIFVFLLFFLISIMFFIYKKWKEHKAALSISQFNQNITHIVNKLDTPEEKIKALEYALRRVEENKKYDRNLAWKNNLIVSVYLHLCNVYKETGNNKKIIEICTRIIELKPDHAKTFHNRGSIYCDMNKLDLAISDLDEAIRLDKSYAQSYNNRGFVYSKMGEHSSAIIDYTHALNIDESAITYYNRGNSYLESGDKENAIDDFRSFLSIYTGNDTELINDVESKIKQ